jgi:hypothetical protein
MLRGCVTSGRHTSSVEEKAAVSPRSEGLKRGESESPGFGHAEMLGDTRMLSCVMEGRLCFFQLFVHGYFFGIRRDYGSNWDN